METTTVEVMHRSLHILRQAETGGNLETTPIYRGVSPSPIGYKHF